MSITLIIVVVLVFLLVAVRRFRTSVSSSPRGFASVRGRSVLFLLFINTAVAYELVDSVVPSAWDEYSFSPYTAFIVLCYSLSGVTIFWYVRRKGVAHRELFGSSPKREVILRFAYLAIPLVVLSIGFMWLVFFPLSYLSPEFTRWWLLDEAPLVIFENGSFLIGPNLVSFLLVAGLVPMIEEYVFRGILLKCWAARWSLPQAVWFSSALFAIGDADILGAFFFGFVASIAYIRSGSLLVPIVIHSVNNGLVWFLDLGASLALGPDYTYSLSEFQSEWWIGALALVAAGPWAWRFALRNLPLTFGNGEGCITQ